MHASGPKLTTVVHASGPKLTTVVHASGPKLTTVVHASGPKVLWLWLIQDNKTTKYNHVLKQTVAKANPG